MNALLEELIALRHGAGKALMRSRRMPARAGSGAFIANAQLIGRGLEFVESRPYAPGDDARSIDWRVTARQGKPHTKLYAEERERPLWMVADFTGSMAFGSRVRLKSEQAARLAAWLAWSGKSAGNRLGGLRVDETAVTTSPALAGDRGVLAWLEILSRPVAAGGRSAAGAGQLASALSLLQARLHAGDRLFVISDFYELDDPAAGANLESALLAAAERAEVHLLRVTDPLEFAPPPPGYYPVRMDGELCWMDLGAAGTRDVWRTLMAERSSRLSALARKNAWPLADISTVDDLAVEMAQFGVV